MSMNKLLNDKMTNKIEYLATDTMPHLLDEVCAKNSKKEALIFDEEHFTFEEFHEICVTLAKNLRKLGISKNHKVAIVLPNCKEFIFLYFALMKIGAWPTPLSTRWEEPEIANVLIDCDPDAVIFADQIGVIDYVTLFENIKEKVPSAQNWIIRNEHQDTVKENYVLLKELFKPVEEEIEFEQVFPQDVALLAYTSGTTGNPKGVMSCHGSLVQTSKFTNDYWQISGDHGISIAPLYAAQGFVALLCNFAGGTKTQFLSTFDPNQILKSISKGECSLFHTQPTMWSLLFTTSTLKFCSWKSLKKVIVSGDICTPALAKQIEEVTGCILLNAYGLIEATATVLLTLPGDSQEIRLNTVGRPLPGIEVKIVNDEREEVPHGEIGELAIRGYTMMGYYKKEAETKAVLDDDGWLYTGDLARFYDDENVTIIGRKKDMIIRGGFNIYPSDIESVIKTHPDIYDVSVVGKRHKVLGEQTVAFVIPKAGKHLTPTDIKAYCTGKIANYKIPDIVTFISQLPIILSGKVKKNELKDWAENGVPENEKFLFE
ncbi:class I adenylate-forming enzyme family protein [Clostridium sp. DJ247]|uniref:class I adenylate-forming enzyme family protein n=1 Tax=Clostridium sp. DJ247 TaxID=2726188 RepID=UPI00162A06BC|nr:class I adenylate-forming enzyme family protein [Clostridium sp. DJ247]MBC2580394.1 acyl--CoA ligase [Clostridium sp. DJ247]